MDPSYVSDMMIRILPFQGFLSDAAKLKLQRKRWNSMYRRGFVLFRECDMKIPHGMYGPLRIVMGYFWAFPCGYHKKTCETKSLGYFAFHPGICDGIERMLIQSDSIQPNQLVFSPDAKSVAMGTWRSCEDDGWFWVYWETTAFSLSQTNSHGSRLSKNVFDMKTKLYDIQRCKNV